LLFAGTGSEQQPKAKGRAGEERISWLPFAFAFATNGIHYGYHVAAKAKAKVEQLLSFNFY
jgi:hypothetical protein